MLALVKKLYFNALRALSTFYAKRKLGSWGRGLTVNYPCVFTCNTHVGADCHFNGMTTIGNGRLVIGDHLHSGSGILVLTQNHNYYSPTALPYDDQDLDGEVHIGNSVWIGSRVIILPKAIVGDGAVLQAGAVVSGKVPRGAVYGGNPARLIKYRDMEKFDQLSREGRYVNWSD